MHFLTSWSRFYSVFRRQTYLALAEKLRNLFQTIELFLVGRPAVVQSLLGQMISNSTFEGGLSSSQNISNKEISQRNTICLVCALSSYLEWALCWTSSSHATFSQSCLASYRELLVTTSPCQPQAVDPIPTTHSKASLCLVGVSTFCVGMTDTATAHIT